MSDCPLYKTDRFIVQMLADGKPRKQIAEDLGVSQSDISRRLGCLRRDFDCATDESLMAKAVRDRWVA